MSNIRTHVGSKRIEAAEVLGGIEEARDAGRDQVAAEICGPR